MHLLTEMSCMHTSISWATVLLHYSVLHGGFVMPDDGDNNYMHMHLGEKTHELTILIHVEGSHIGYVSNLGPHT